MNSMQTDESRTIHARLELQDRLPLSKRAFADMSPEFRIGAIVSDGLWYSFDKWRKLAKVQPEVLQAWIDEHLDDGTLIQAECRDSFRFPLSSMRSWYAEHRIRLGSQLLDFIFPARVWDHKSETEGFLEAPIRRIGILTVFGNDGLLEHLNIALRGVGVVKEASPGVYKIYCLSYSYARSVIEAYFSENNLVAGVDYTKVYGRGDVKRREICDFSQQFAQGIVLFYRHFARSMLRREMETIRIFLPDKSDQDSQILIWVLMALEKFDESSAVPFAGYLSNVLKRWPYNLPSEFLGKELSNYQRVRSRTINRLREEGKDASSLTSLDLAREMGISEADYREFEEKHRIWSKMQSATTLIWDESADEKSIDENSSLSISPNNVATPTNVELANKLSCAIIYTALETDDYDSAIKLINQMDRDDISKREIKALSPYFVEVLAGKLRM